MEHNRYTSVQRSRVRYIGHCDGTRSLPVEQADL